MQYLSYLCSNLFREWIGRAVLSRPTLAALLCLLVELQIPVGGLSFTRLTKMPSSQYRRTNSQNPTEDVERDI